MPAERTGATPRYLAAPMAELPDHDRWLTAAESERLQSFHYTKRREEARLGRWTAKRALARALDVAEEADALRSLVIRNASDGAPEVFVDDRPAPLRISMTDRADWAVCTVLEGAGEIGCDLELVEHRTEAFVRDYFTEAEQRLCASGTIEWALCANLVWSAKESALKVLRTGLRRDTRSVEVTVGGEVAAGWTGLRVSTVEGATFPGWWRRFGAFVLTYVSERPSGPPVSLADPAPLEAAVPSHTWMLDPRRRAVR